MQLLDQLLGDRRGEIHGWRRINFDEPDVEIFVKHEVVPEQRVRIVSMVEPLLRGEHRCYHCLIDLRLDFLNPVVFDFVTELVLQEGLHLMRLPHVVPDHVPAALRNFPCSACILLCDAGIGQVHEFVLSVGRIVVL